MNKIHMSLLCGVTLLVVASAAFAADEKKSDKAAEGSRMQSVRRRARPFVVRGNMGFHYGDHLNIYTMKSHGTMKTKGYLDLDAK